MNYARLEQVKLFLKEWDQEASKHRSILAQERAKGTREYCVYMNHHRAMKNHYEDKVRGARRVLNLLEIEL